MNTKLTIQDAIKLRNKLAILMVSKPENEEQAKRKEKLIYEYQIKLGILKKDEALVEYGELKPDELG